MSEMTDLLPSSLVMKSLGDSCRETIGYYRVNYWLFPPLNKERG